MNKEEIKHFKSLLRQGVLRHINISLDAKFQQELLNIIKEYENIEQENKQLENNWNELKKWLQKDDEENYTNFEMGRCFNYQDILDKMEELEKEN